MIKRLMTTAALATALVTTSLAWADKTTDDTGDTGTKTSMPTRAQTTPPSTGTGGMMGSGGTSGTGDTGSTTETGGHRHKHKKGHGSGGTSGSNDTM